MVGLRRWIDMGPRAEGDAVTRPVTVDELEHLLSDLEIVNASRAEAIARGEWTPEHDARRDRVRKLVNEHISELLTLERKRCARVAKKACVHIFDNKECAEEVAAKIRRGG